jgi:tetratricopeptide (TPR) repeat protein
MRAPRLAFVAILLLASFTGALAAQSHTALGDKEYVAMNAPAALAHYEAAIAADPKDYEALWKASRAAVDIGSYDGDAEKRGILYKKAEQYARRAVEANPGDAEGHFHLARALGKNALTQGVRARVRYATDVRAQALECLKTHPKHPGCLHVMGVWNAEVMRLNGFSRMLARNLLGGKVFGSANWAEAQRYMEESVAAEPDRIVHYVDLAEIYKDVGNKAKAKAAWEMVMKLPLADYNDRHYKAQADRGLRSL